MRSLVWSLITFSIYCRGGGMKKLAFLAECVSRSIAPEIALEDAEVVVALKKRDDAGVKALLDKNF